MCGGLCDLFAPLILGVANSKKYAAHHYILAGLLSVYLGSSSTSDKHPPTEHMSMLSVQCVTK